MAFSIIHNTLYKIQIYMDIKQKKINTQGLKFYIKKDGREMARASLFIIKNDLHNQPYGLMEDVFVDETLRGQGIGTQLAKRIIESAKKNKCYKLIANSRRSRIRVHKLYKKLGFKNYGFEFRMDFDKMD